MKANMVFRRQLDALGIYNPLMEKNSFVRFLEKSNYGDFPQYSSQDVQHVKKEGYRFIILHEVDFIKAGRSQKENDPEFGRNNYRKLKALLRSSKLFKEIRSGTEYDYFFMPIIGKEMDAKYEILLFKIR